MHSKKKITKGRKPNKTWVDQGSQFCNQSFKDFLKGDNIGMYSTYNEEKYVVAERFIRTIIHKYMTIFQKMFIIMCWTILLINIIILFKRQ